MISNRRTRNLSPSLSSPISHLPSPLFPLFLLALLLLPSSAVAQTCDDGFRCTVNDMCVEDTCVGTAVECADDGNVCTRERCSLDSGSCESEARRCPGECMTGECDPVTGCVPRPDDTPCDDGSVCTTDDRCLVGFCRGTPVADGTPCTDGFGPCTINDSCQRGSCSGQFLRCSNIDGDACTEEACDFRSGSCISLLRRTCTGPCETGTCDAQSGLCPTQSDGIACDDGNVCTMDDGCAAGQCIGGALIRPATPTPTATVPEPSPTSTLAPTATAPAPTRTAPPPSATATRSHTPTTLPTTTPVLPSPTRTEAAAQPSAAPSATPAVIGRGCSVAATEASRDITWLLAAVALVLARRRSNFHQHHFR